MSKQPANAAPQRANQIDLSTWLGQAEQALKHTYGICPGTVRLSAWRDEFIRGLSPAAAADRVATGVRNSRLDRLRATKRR